jgi:hypothetical protein
MPGAKVDVTWTCGLHILLFLRFGLWLGRVRVTSYDRFVLRPALVATAYPGSNTVHSERKGTAERGRRGGGGIGWEKEWLG